MNIKPPIRSYRDPSLREPSESLERSDGAPPESERCFQILRTIPPLSPLSMTELRSLAESSRIATVRCGEYIAVEGDDESASGFVVASGRLAMMKTSLSGKELVVELLAPGDIFGLMLTLSSERHSAQLSARAQIASQVLWIPVKSVLPIFGSHLTVYREFLSALLQTLQSSYRLSRGLAHDRVEVRIATILVTLALKFARPTPARQDYTVDITRQQIADLTGTTPETAIRVTRTMQQRGIIDITRPGVVRVMRLEELQRLSDGELSDSQQ